LWIESFFADDDAHGSECIAMQMRFPDQKKRKKSDGYEDKERIRRTVAASPRQ
jgi:hypothetical protein